MSDDESDAEFERRYPRKQSGMPVWAIVLLVLGAVGFLGVFGLFALGMVFGALGARAASGPPAVAVATVEPLDVPEEFTRPDFERLVTGKTADEVRTAVGEPMLRDVSVQQDGELNGEETLWYFGLTVNPTTGRTDEVTEVVFRGGKVVRVDYRDGPPPGGPGPPAGK